MISPFLHEASQATPFSFIDKIINHEAAVKQASSSWLPGGTALLYPAMAVELLMPPMIVVGFYDGMAAFVLAGYCAVSALLFHNFWASPRFWSSDSEGYPHVWDFFKDFGLVGGNGRRHGDFCAISGGGCEGAAHSLSWERLGESSRRSFRRMASA